jgi:hypothetical protein
MIDYDQRERIEKVQDMEYDEAEKQIFEWAKTGVITLRQFRELNQANRDAV